jgi:hypothetical protein
MADLFEAPADAAIRSAIDSGEASPRNPTTGGTGCCARATCGQVVAAAPRSLMNSRRRLMSNLSPTPSGVRLKPLQFRIGLIQYGRLILRTPLQRHALPAFVSL